MCIIFLLYKAILYSNGKNAPWSTGSLSSCTQDDTSRPLYEKKNRFSYLRQQHDQQKENINK